MEPSGATLSAAAVLGKPVLGKPVLGNVVGAAGAPAPASVLVPATREAFSGHTRSGSATVGGTRRCVACS
jgi:hypothetical protein